MHAQRLNLPAGAPPVVPLTAAAAKPSLHGPSRALPPSAVARRCPYPRSCLMRRIPLSAGVLLLAMTAFAGAAAAQPPPGSQLPNPRLTVLTPNGGKAGTTLEVSFT